LAVFGITRLTLSGMTTTMMTAVNNFQECLVS
jgi:hypothetical protein